MRIYAIVFVAGIAAACFTEAKGPPEWPKDWPSFTPELAEKGKATYKVNCAMCHGDQGDGKGPAGIAMTPPPRSFASVKEYKRGSKATQLYQTIKEGLPGTAMAPFAHISDEELKALVAYLTTFQKSASRPSRK